MSEEPEFAPKCIWCSAPWSEENVALEVESSGCESGGWDYWATIKITCHVCNKLMYEKSGSAW